MRYLPYRQSDRVRSFVLFFCSFWGCLIRGSRAGGSQLKTTSWLLVGCRGSALSRLLCSSTRLRQAVSASKAFVWRTGSPHPLHRRVCGGGLRRESPKRAEQQQQQRRCNKMVIDNTHGCHRMAVHAAGGWRTGCATPGRRQQQQQQQQLQHSSSQASIGAVVWCDRVSCGVVRDAVGFKKIFDRAIRSAHLVEKSRLSRRDVRIGLLHRKNWDRKGTFSTA